jgi:hypothetical protein
MEKLCKARQATDDDIIQPMCFSWWTSKDTVTLSEPVTPIVFPLQKRLRERASVLHYTYVFLGSISFISHNVDVRENTKLLTT